MNRLVIPTETIEITPEVTMVGFGESFLRPSSVGALIIDGRVTPVVFDDSASTLEDGEQREQMRKNVAEVQSIIFEKSLEIFEFDDSIAIAWKQ